MQAIMSSRPIICSGCTLPRAARRCLLCGAACTFVTAVAILAGADALVRGRIHDSLTIVPGSPLYLNWVRLPIPLVNAYYLFNVTNLHQLRDPTRTLEDVRLEEIGPYVFDEYRYKQNMTWFERNDSVSYRQRRVYHFNERETKGGLDDLVVSLNPVLAGANRKFKHEPREITDFKDVVEPVMFTDPERPPDTPSSLLLSGTVGQLLFDGIYNEAFRVASEGVRKAMRANEIPEDISYFRDANDSGYTDKHLNMLTGSRDVRQIGAIATWEYSRYVLSNWERDEEEGECGRVVGGGDYFPPFLEKGPVDFFATDLCRTMHLEYVGTEETSGIETYKYILPRSYFSSWSSNETGKDRRCFRPFDEWEHPDGIIDTSPCRKGNAPVYMSRPHFYQAHASLRRRFMPGTFRPRRERHETVFHLEPTTGLTSKITARLQLNMRLQPLEEIEAFAKIPSNLVFPILWVEQKVLPPPHIRNEVFLLSGLKRIVIGAGMFFLSLSISFTVILLIHEYNIRRYISDYTS